MFIPERWLAFAGLCFAVLCLLLFWVAIAHAQHKPGHMALHHQFYSTWTMPDNRGVSCCHDQDCEPAEAHQIDGIWYARKESERETYPEFIRIPPNKVEQERDSPDGRSHMCGRRYGFTNMQMSVFCFLPAAGG